MTLSKEALFVLSIATVRVALPFRQKTEIVCRKILSKPLFKLDIEKPVHTEETRSTISTWVSYYLSE